MIKNNISSDEILKNVGKFQDDKESKAYIINFLDNFKVYNNLDCLRIVLKTCFVWKDKILSEHLVDFIDKFLNLNESEMFEIKAEIDFAINIISMLPCNKSLQVLEKYAFREDLENLNLSAIRAIYCLQTTESKNILFKLSKHPDEVIAETAANLLK